MAKRGSGRSAASAARTPAATSKSSDLVFSLQAEVSRLRRHVSVLSRRLHDCESERLRAQNALRSHPPLPPPPRPSFVESSPSPGERVAKAVVGSSLPRSVHGATAPPAAEGAVAATGSSRSYGVKRAWSGSDSKSASVAIATIVSTSASSGPPTHPAAALRRMGKKQPKRRRIKFDASEPVALRSPEGEKRVVESRLEEPEPHLCPERKLDDGKIVWRCPCKGSFSSDRYNYVPGLRYHWAHHGCTEIKMVAVGLVDDEVPNAPLDRRDRAGLPRHDAVWLYAAGSGLCYTGSYNGND
ncbi:unnamed protein product [Tuber aestivum]|uniref:Uncharacterized protein n=1 Tax=Tuber aestivum TaxID=59557 RepID=A0A292Q1T4_9PEZI|nr:unnamed protein product [Tuber aestivum]